MGGIDKFVEQKYEEKMNNLQETIASLGALPRTTENKAHVFEDFHSSRTIRKLILDCPNFAICLWEAALKGRAATWAQGHRSEVNASYKTRAYLPAALLYSDHAFFFDLYLPL